MNLKPLFDSDLTQSFPTANGHPLLWRPDLGIGYLKSNGLSYEDNYWQKYQVYKATELGRQLNAYRTSFVRRWLKEIDTLCDVGIGSGHFVEEYPCKGYDVNALAVEWLVKHDSYADPYDRRFDALSFWDVLEHIDEPAPLLTVKHVFMSIPIHLDVHACLRSKHLRPDEHIWHFTHDGLELFMRLHGYELRFSDNGETKLGREDIMSYYFRRF